jgi:ribosomal protein S18 acetylase RimI-like enzyme
MIVQRATVSDCRDVATIHVESWQHAYKDVMPAPFLASLSVGEREAMWRQLVERNTEHLLIARVNKQIIGFVAFDACQDESRRSGDTANKSAPPRSAELWAIYVKPSYWSSGVGRALWLSALQQLRQENFLTVSLWVLSENHRAIAFYKRAGFNSQRGFHKQFEVDGFSLEEQRYSRAVAE